MNLAQTILGIHFSNPTVLASGIWGITASGWRRVAANGAGAVTTKSLWLHEHRGHPNPTIISTEHWTLNAVGVPDAGIEKARQEIGDYMKDKPVPLIANVIAESIGDYGKVSAEVLKLKPDFLEVNISCPNVEDEFGRPFACSVADASAVTEAVKRVSGKTPVFIKLSPNVDNIGAIAAACAEKGADGFTVINTVGPGMAIDLKSRMPILANKVGGMSGPAIKPIAVRCIADVYKATEGKLPIIGTGGIMTGEDAIEFLLAGASLIGIGTAIAYRGDGVFKLVCEEMKAWCQNEGVKNISELVGGMHTALRRSNK
ncbi:MAG: dihydroorotate dehydrogenase [Candidatus Peribacteraceae bacterium]|nr:dihydroorotate dehydrogenase [Candidatus Peribacteraceae bacterium]MDD5074465.1 dihydroorotate dehydrogenase [Candidatus Peribacteraceae bacterium]